MFAEDPACRVTLEAFEGPLDLLLFLIRRDELDILDIEVARVADQYLEFIRGMQDLNLNLASEYLVMAATLTRMKSRSILPSRTGFDEDGEDPQTQLLRQLVLYRAFREVSAELKDSESVWRDVFPSPGERNRWTDGKYEMVPGQTTLIDLLTALDELTSDDDQPESFSYLLPALSLTECIESIRFSFEQDSERSLNELLGPEPTRRRTIAFFVAVLELIRRGWLEFRQGFPFADIILNRTRRWP